MAYLDLPLPPEYSGYKHMSCLVLIVGFKKPRTLFLWAFYTQNQPSAGLWTIQNSRQASREDRLSEVSLSENETHLSSFLYPETEIIVLLLTLLWSPG